MRHAIKHPILTYYGGAAIRAFQTSLAPSRGSIKPASQAAGRTLNASQSSPDKLCKAWFLPPTCSCHVVPINNTSSVDPAFSFLISGITWLDQYIGELWCKCYHVEILHTEPPTSQEGQRQLCLSLYLPCSTCPRMLCCFVCTSFYGSLFLFPSLSVSFSIVPSPSLFPTGDLFFSYGIWDPIHPGLIVGLLSIPEDGPWEAEWVTVGTLVSPFSLVLLSSPPHVLLFAMRWCHGFYLLGGYPLILSPFYTLHLSLFPSTPNLLSCFPPPVPLPDCIASQKPPRGFVDVWMLFSTPTVHAWHRDGEATNPSNPTLTPI